METEKRTNRPQSLGQLLQTQPPRTSDDFEIVELSTVTLTDDEREEALAVALERKKELVRHNNGIALRKRQEHEASRQWSAADYMRYFQNEVSRLEELKGFRIDEYNHETIKALCEYFANDPRFEARDESYSLKKGLLICGNVGCGKTTLMRIFSRNTKRCFAIMESQTIADRFSTLGAETIHLYSGSLDVANSFRTYFQTKVGICYDDLGVERMGKHYGDSANVMEQLLLLRYSRRELPWWFTHVTTNLSPEKIEESYGTRVRSRFREMFNMIVLPGNDRRK